MNVDPATTALIVIDLQRGVVARNCTPHSSADVVTNAARLLRRFRELGALVVLVIFPRIGTIVSTEGSLS